MEHFLTTAKLSALAYQDPADIENEIHKDGFENFYFIENSDTDTQAFLCSLPEVVFLSFRGTTFTSWDDWVTNLDCGFEPCPFGRVHTGFWQDVGSVYLDIMSELVKHIVQQRHLIITGHSQGAGDANAMGLKMLGEYRDVYRVIHYGGPRTVDSVAANHIDTFYPDVFHRIVNNNDLVTRVPPRISGYKHFGNLHYFLQTGEYTTNISAWEMFLDRIQGKIADIGELHLDCLQDHMIDSEYIRLVERAVDSRFEKVV